MKKAVIILIFLLTIPMVYAGDCGITNLGSCLPEKIFEFIISTLNIGLQPLLNLTKTLLGEPVNIAIFKKLWSLIIYIISFFYSLLFMWAGINLIISSHDTAKRYKAKEWLKNVFLMLITVQTSYFLYTAILEISSLLSSGILNIIGDKFFLLTADNIPNLLLQFIFGGSYVVTLLTTVILLSIRYLLVSAGLLFFPIGLFFYFIPPLQSYGKLIINTILTLAFLPFFLCLILLSASLTLGIPAFANIKIIIMIGAFTLVDLTIIFLILFAMIKSAFIVLNSDIGRAAKYLL